jgi:hypothetical protein
VVATWRMGIVKLTVISRQMCRLRALSWRYSRAVCRWRLGHQRFDIAIAAGKTLVQPPPVADELGREPLTLGQMGSMWCVHTVRMPHWAETV